MNARSERPDEASDEAAEPASYREPLRVPVWWYAVGLFVAGLIAAEFRIAGVDVTSWLPFVVLLPLSCVIVWSLGRGELSISGGEIRVRGAHLPLEFVSGAVALDGETLRRVVGREGDPAAFLSIRPWIGPGVQLWLDDPEDPVPYWVVSSRHPQQVVELIRAELSAG